MGERGENNLYNHFLLPYQKKLIWPTLLGRQPRGDAYTARKQEAEKKQLGFAMDVAYVYTTRELKPLTVSPTIT